MIIYFRPFLLFSFLSAQYFNLFQIKKKKVVLCWLLALFKNINNTYLYELFSHSDRTDMENIYSFCVPNDFPSVSLPNPFSDFLEYKYTLKMECTDLSRNLFAQGMMIAKSSHVKDSFEAHLSFNWQLVQVAVLLGKAKPRQRITSGGREAWKGIHDSLALEIIICQKSSSVSKKFDKTFYTFKEYWILWESFLKTFKRKQ